MLLLTLSQFNDGNDDSETGYLMLVDLRTSMAQGGVAPRAVNLTLASSCTAQLVPGGPDGWAATWQSSRAGVAQTRCVLGSWAGARHPFHLSFIPNRVPHGVTPIS